ncbi:MAG: hypothetical protein ACQESE_01280 [Nanobdellota archaeon]
MPLNDKLKTATIEELKQVDILMIDSYGRRNKEILNFLYNHGIIDDSSIEGALEVAVFNQARQDYNLMTIKGGAYTIYADHIGRPDCLAYALDKDTFSKKEIENIPFDHEDTAETYYQKYGEENLLSLIREELLNPGSFL